MQEIVGIDYNSVYRNDEALDFVFVNCQTTLMPIAADWLRCLNSSSSFRHLTLLSVNVAKSVFMKLECGPQQDKVQLILERIGERLQALSAQFHADVQACGYRLHVKGKL